MISQLVNDPYLEVPEGLKWVGSPLSRSYAKINMEIAHFVLESYFHNSWVSFFKGQSGELIDNDELFKKEMDNLDLEIFESYLLNQILEWILSSNRYDRFDSIAVSNSFEKMSLSKKTWFLDIETYLTDRNLMDLIFYLVVIKSDPKTTLQNLPENL